MIRIRLMTAADLPLGMRLKEAAGWNQTEADWKRFLDLEPGGCFVAERDGTPSGTAATLQFGPVAWVAMVLVDPAARRRGVGTALMEHALEFLEQRSVRSIRLDATPMGQPLYEKLGFAVEYTLARHEGVLPEAPAVAGVEPAGPGDMAGVLRLDRTVTGTDRSKALLRLFAENRDAVHVVKRGAEVVGYRTVRTGRRALLIGPCLATADAGPLLLGDAWHRCAGQRVYIDIPTENAAATALAEAQGLTVQRHLVRMCRGPSVGERVAELWASSGPEKG